MTLRQLTLLLAIFCVFHGSVLAGDKELFRDPDQPLQKRVEDLISRLTLEMNRARQAQITKELMDIVGGAEALRG